MTLESTAFKSEHIPLHVNKSSIKVLQKAKDAFSLERAIFNPKVVKINMYPVTNN